MTSAREWTRTFGDSTERRTVPPDTMTPSLTIESTADPRRSSKSWTNFAGGHGWRQVRMGHFSL